jgi:isochorismate pyruvate lyase
MNTRFATLEEVRREIDRIDRQLVELVARRGTCVPEAARFKSNAEDIPAPERVQQILSQVTALAAEIGADPGVVEATWRAMIAAFIQAERRLHAGLSASFLNHESQDPPCPCPSPTLA